MSKGIGVKGFPNEQAREFARQGINSSLNRVAWDYLALGSPKAQQYGLDIFTQGQVLINTQPNSVNNVNRKLFYEQMEIQMLDDAKREEWSHQDLAAVAQFIKSKYKFYIQSEDPVLARNELLKDL